MLLYFNGDSFVAGDELGDDILNVYPGTASYPMNTTDPKSLHVRNKKWLVNTNTPGHPLYKERVASKQKLSKLEFERAFPNKVHQLTQFPIINHALGGASMDRISRTTVADLCYLRRKKPNEKIIAFIGTTYPSRTEVPAEGDKRGADPHGHTVNWDSISPTYQVIRTKEVENLVNYFARYQTTYHAAVNFYKNIILIQDHCKLNDIQLHWIATHDNIVNEYVVESDVLDQYDLFALREYANLQYSVDMKDFLPEFNFQDVLCPGGHFSEPVHERTAEKIVEILQTHEQHR
jgi:hypothetical protein